ncbi:hypothetical protein Bca101_016293 [Brassica carinata]
MDSSSSSPARFIMRDAESSASQFISGQHETTDHVAGTKKVEGEDGRAIFLAFSRGYPVSNSELHAYFTRRHGDIIEAIHMGAGGGYGQALYATMVLHSAAKIQEILNGGVFSTKFTINGKHVWARKFKS